MTIHICRFAVEHEDRVRALNRRLRAGGCSVTFPGSHLPRWLPYRQERKLFQEYFVAVDEHAEIRGGYVLKHQEFYCKGKTQLLAGYQLPLSEGIVDKQYKLVGAVLLADALRRQPALFAMGMGGLREPLPLMLRAARWQLASIPFFFRVLRPKAFLMNIAPLRSSAAGRWICNLLAASGLGWPVVRSAHLCRGWRYRLPRSVAVEQVPDFGPWADELWDGCKDRYGFVAVRDRRVLDILYPAENTRFIRLKVARHGALIGWAVVLATAMRGHKYFGNMRVGSLVDCLAAPEDAIDTAAAAADLLQARGADLIVSNQSHNAWGNALRRCGFLTGPSNYLFAASEQLAAETGCLEDNLASMHLNRGDGDGPINL